MSMLERVTYALCATFALSVAVVAFTVLELAALQQRRDLDAIPPPAVIDGPAEPVYRHDTRCPPPELRGEPEPGLHLGDEGEECQP